MTTPLGGARSEALWMDDDGKPVAPEDATRAEIVEYDEDGVVLGRTYMDSTRAPQDVPVVSEIHNHEITVENQEWIKSGDWDIWVVRNGVWEKKVETLAELLEAMEWNTDPTDEVRFKLSNLMELPTWLPAPQPLKDEVGAWMEANRV